MLRTPDGKFPNCSTLLLAVAFSLLVATAAPAETSYLIDGKSVPKNVYDAAVLSQEANSFIASGNLDRAAGKLRMSLQCDPDSSLAHGNLGIIFARQGKNAEALVHLKKSIKSEDCSALAYMNLASFYQSTGDLDGAIDTFKIFIGRSSSSAKMKEYAENILKMLENERARRLKDRAVAGGQAGSGDYFIKPTSAPLARWTEFRMPLKVYIDPAPEAEGYAPHYGDLLRQAFVDWEKASDRKVSFLFEPEKEKSDIECSWTADADKLGNGTENGNAATGSRLGALVHAQIILRSKESHGSFPFSENTVLSTCRHEVGHALGISWHSPDPGDLMYFSVPLADREQNISNRDRNTLLKLYATDVSWLASFYDFASSPGNLKNCLPILLVVLVLLVLLRLLVPKKKKKRS